MTLQEVQAAMLAKCAASNLDSKAIKLLRFQPFTLDACKQTFNGTLPLTAPGFRIPYFGINGKPTEFFRYRYLQQNGFAALTTKALRYAQPAGSLNELYLPPLADWKAIAKDVSKQVMITEGELKSACACLFGFPTIGLGGAWCFKSAAQNLPLLPGFDLITWKDRVVFICYDSDAVINPDVTRAENALARQLLGLGAIPYICRLPAIAPPAKTGLDDYLVACGAEQFRTQVLDAAGEWNAAEALYALNEEVLYVQDPGLILKVDTGQRMSHRAFVEHAYAPRTYWEAQTGPKGSVKHVEKSAPKEWLKWNHRAEVARVTYAPGAARITAANEYNLWSGLAVEPKHGDVAPWRRLMKHLTTGLTAAEAKWLEQWFAYPLQHPGIKLYSAVVLWGLQHGVGKSLLGYTMFAIYGERNTYEIGDRELAASFTEWAENKQFIMATEVTGATSTRQQADHLKRLITQPYMRINTKYIPAYKLPDCVNWYFTSNHPLALYIENDNERRYFVHEVTVGPLAQQFYDDYVRWLKQEGGAAAILDYLLNLDLTGFQPHGAPPRTAAMLDMVELGQGELLGYLQRVQSQDKDVTPLPGPVRLFNANELMAYYTTPDGRQVGPQTFARVMAQAGLRKVNRDSKGRAQGVRIEMKPKPCRVNLWARKDDKELFNHSEKQLAALYAEERKAWNR